MKKLDLNLHLHKNGKLFGFGVSPNADWKAIFVGLILLTFLMAVLGVYMFVKISQGGIFMADKKEPEIQSTLDLITLKKTVRYYENRAKIFEEIKKTKDSTVDPTL
ncbi:MAG: hypothetical protein AB200_02095 [Parcubacteria bacterium C7867-005]|nr:MAG: hypothetical protein AB200_02095 [Parcubacteria bacterium C7867-005]